jgi:hypothetical protein
MDLTPLQRSANASFGTTEYVSAGRRWDMPAIPVTHATGSKSMLEAQTLGWERQIDPTIHPDAKLQTLAA